MPPVTSVQPSQLTAARQCREIPLQIVSPGDRTLTYVPLSAGVCVPRGQLAEPGTWLLDGLAGVQSAVETEVLHRWSDGSVRWMLVRFIARRLQPGRTTCTLVRGARPPGRKQTTSRLDAEDSALRLTFESPEAEASRSVIIRPQLFNASAQPLPIQIVQVRQTMQQNLFQQFVVQCENASEDAVTLQLTLDVWPQTGLVKLDARLRNSRRAIHAGGCWDLGDTGSFCFRGMHLKLGAANGGTVDDPTLIRWKTSRAARVRQQPGGAVQLLQTGSGGPAFSNGNHRNANANSTVRDRGYEARFDRGTLRGYRCDPVVAVAAAEQDLTVAVPDFWQNFPTSLTAETGAVNVGLFPIQNEEVFELQGGEQKTQTVWLRTSDRLNDSTIDRQTEDDRLTELDWVYQPVRCSQPLPWIRSAAVFDWLPDTDALRSRSTRQSPADRYLTWLTEATTGRHSVAARRERADEFGWRNFGDVPADHEQQHYAGRNTIASHYNNQFDLVYGAILNLAVSGDHAWFDLFEPLSRHVMDIDRYHTDQDRACFNGGLFWHTDHYVDAWTSTHRTYSDYNAGDQPYGGGPSNEHNYTTGLLHYYFLTGDREAYAAVTELADWVVAMDDGRATIWSLLDDGPTGLASQTVLEDFHGPGRGAGNSINALVDAWTLTRRSVYLQKADELIRRVVHPELDCDALHLADAEGHWSYTVCLLAIGRYLAARLEAEQLDEHYAYARASLAHIGRWMAEHEQPALDHPDKLEYPTVAWAAQEFRKANVLRIAAACESDAAIEVGMRRKADALSDAAWRDFQSFGTENLTARCFSIVMTEGLRDLFHRNCRAEYFPPSQTQPTDWGTWRMFVPQKLRVKALLRNPVALAAAAPKLLNPIRWSRTIQALKRQLGK